MISHFSKYRLEMKILKLDLMGSAKSTLSKCLRIAQERKEESFIHLESSEIISCTIKTSAGMKIYDPTVGSGGMLIQTRNYLKKWRKS